MATKHPSPEQARRIVLAERARITAAVARINRCLGCDAKDLEGALLELEKMSRRVAREIKTLAGRP